MSFLVNTVTAFFALVLALVASPILLFAQTCDVECAFDNGRMGTLIHNTRSPLCVQRCMNSLVAEQMIRRGNFTECGPCPEDPEAVTPEDICPGMETCTNLQGGREGVSLIRTIGAGCNSFCFPVEAAQRLVNIGIFECGVCEEPATP